MNEFQSYVDKMNEYILLNPKQLIASKEWEIEKLDFNREVIALANTDTNAVILNQSNTSAINEDYVLVHEFFHILEGKFSALKSNILEATDLNQLEYADIFAYLYFSKKNELSKVPENITKIFQGLAG